MRVLPLLLLTTACAPQPVDYPPVRFAVIGDWGEGNDTQQQVADVLASVCADDGCDQVLSMGDNFYDVGVLSNDDTLFDERWRSVYSGVESEWLMSLGNHDYGIFGEDADRAENQLAYNDPNWYLPAHHYQRTLHNVDFVALDTNWLIWWSIFTDKAESMGTWLDELVANQPEDHWLIPFGHHPIFSNGSHGDAGGYDGLSPEFPNIAGSELLAWMQQHLCGQADVYLAGHDHDRQWHEETCDGTTLMVSGAGAKLRPFMGDRPLVFGDDSVEGFLWVEIDDDVMTTRWWNKNGEVDHEGTVTRDITLRAAAE